MVTIKLKAPHGAVTAESRQISGRKLCCSPSDVNNIVMEGLCNKACACGRLCQLHRLSPCLDDPIFIHPVVGHFLFVGEAYPDTGAHSKGIIIKPAVFRRLVSNMCRQNIKNPSGTKDRLKTVPFHHPQYPGNTIPVPAFSYSAYRPPEKRGQSSANPASITDMPISLPPR